MVTKVSQLNTTHNQKVLLYFFADRFNVNINNSTFLLKILLFNFNSLVIQQEATIRIKCLNIRGMITYIRKHAVTPGF